MADDRLPCRRSVSMDDTRSDNVMLRSSAISFRPCQKASSRLTLVLWPAITMERLTTGDFIDGLLVQCDADQESDGPDHGPPPLACAPLWMRRGQHVVQQHAVRLCCDWHACEPFADSRFQTCQSSTV